jgi:acetyl esterase/lipase
VPSLLSHVLVAYLRATRRKRPFKDPRVLRAQIAKERTTIDPAPPKTLATRTTIERRTIDGTTAYTLSPRDGRRADRHVLFLHGGCYVFEVSPYHWRFCASLVERLGCKVTLPLYPLAPEHGAAEVLRRVTSVYRAVLAESAPGLAAIMGDSAGGGMALALAQLLEDAGLPQPKDIVLLSPWLDVGMTHPAIPAADARDPWLSRPGLVEAGRLYAHGLAADDPRLSPLHGELSKLGTLSVFIGTRDILLPDARLLCDRAREVGASVTMFEYDEMVHDFMLIDLLPEAKRALADIEAVLQRP